MHRRSRHATICSSVMSLLLFFGTASRALGEPVIGTSGDQFTLNNVPRFLLFVAYYDAMRRSNAGGQNNGDLDTDFSFIRGRGIEGIRIFPNWFHYT